MRLSSFLCGCASLLPLVTSTILQNGQVRITDFPNTTIPSLFSNSSGWKTYGPSSSELSYKGRWDSKHISWWSAPGLKFAFTGPNLAISFGNETSPGVLIAFRFSGFPWQFTNVTASSTHQFASLNHPDTSSALPSQLPITFELRVTNWAYGVQIENVHVSKNESLLKVPDFKRRIEIIGDSIACGMFATYEGLSSFSYSIGAGLGDTEFSISAFTGLCLHDASCWGNPRGLTYQWFQTSDTSDRARALWNDTPEAWDFAKEGMADIVLIHAGTNDGNSANHVSTDQFVTSYLYFVQSIHKVYPKANIVLVSLWSGFYTTGVSWAQSGGLVKEIYRVYETFKDEGWLHYFNTTGILQHNDIGPQAHPTDVGHVKVASHIMQWIQNKFGWEFAATGPEVQHDTVYLNDEKDY